MCRSIKPLFNFDPPATDEEIRAASLQFVRKVSGMRKPSRLNEAAFEAAVTNISNIAARLIDSLESSAMPRSRDTVTRGRGDGMTPRHGDAETRRHGDTEKTT